MSTAMGGLLTTVEAAIIELVPDLRERDEFCEMLRQSFREDARQKLLTRRHNVRRTAQETGGQSQ